MADPSVVDALNTLRVMAAYVPIEDHYGTHPRKQYDEARAVVETALADHAAVVGRALRVSEAWREERARAVAAEAERDTLRQALREIAAKPYRAEEVVARHRAVLADNQPT